jgi:tetratricopeptide (TPR) repeat protein
MLSSRQAFAGLLAMSVLFVGAIPIAAKDAEWENHFNAGTKAEIEGNYAEAQNELAEALKLTAKFQMNDPRLAKTYYESGELKLKQEDWSTAQQYFERALKVQDKLGDPLSVDIGNTVAGLATAHEQLGNHQMAVLLLKRVRNIWIKQYGANDGRLMTILPAMATYAMLDSDYATAQECYKQLVSVAEKTSGSNSTDYGSALNSLASCLAYIGKFAEAEPYARRAVDVLNAAGDSPTALDAANANLQYICQKLGKPAPVVSEKPAAAAPVVTQAPAVTQPAVATQPTVVTQAPVAKAPVVPPPPPPTTSTLKVTGQLIAKPQEPTPPAKAHEPPKVATAPVVIAPVVSTATPPSTNTGSAAPGKVQYLAGGKLVTPEQFKAMTLANNAFELMREEKFIMAVQILKNALAIFPDLASAHSNLGMAYSQLGQFNDAETHLKKAISIDASRPSAWLNLASTFLVEGNLKDAVATYGEFVQRFPNQKLVAKVQGIKSQLDRELKEQAQVEQGKGQTSTDYFTYASQGASRWPADKSTIKVYVAAGTSIAGFKPEYAGFLTESFKQWETACPNVRFQFVKSGSGSDIECTWSDDTSKLSSPLEGGDTQIQHGGKNISHAAITILTKGPNADTPLSPNQIRVVCLHQIGHALGISGHSPKPQDVMYCSLPPASVKTPLSQRDTATIQKLYTQLVSFLF